MKPTLVTSYINPDLDGVASAVAYAEFLCKIDKKAIAGFIGEPHEEAKYIFNRFNFAYPQIISNADNFDTVILVDLSSPSHLERRVDSDKVIEIIDHRKAHDAEEFINAKIQIEFVGAAATLIAEKFIENKIDISRESAILLSGAIISNTLNFKGTVTTDRDIKAARWLDQFAKLPESFWQELFAAKSDLSGNKLIERIKGDFSPPTINNKRIGIAQIEMIGAEKLIEERLDEIISVLEKTKQEMHLDFIFQNTIALDDAKTFLVTHDIDTQKILEEILLIKFIGMVAEYPGLIMRKQIVPLLKDRLI